MRILFFLLFACLFNQHITAQVESPRKQLPQKEVREGQSSKREIQAQLLSAANELNTQIADLEKQLADAIKNKEDEETIKGFRDQIAILKKQVEMMGGLKKTVSSISEKTFQQAGEEEPFVLKKDDARIKMLRKKILTKTEFALFIKNVHTQVERMIPPAEKAEAIRIYNETKEEYKSVGVIANAASGCWMMGHWEKALYLMGRACIDDIDDADNLNNYASFLISTGAEQAAVPILEYLNVLFPKNSTILNNIGQAWFGLGDLDNAKKNLEEATLLYPSHSMANATLANVARSEGNNEKAIAFLKSSLKETYDTEKEAELTKLGYSIKYDDMPEFNYPMRKDPFNIISLIELFPENFPSHIGDDATVDAVNDFVGGATKLSQELNDENQILENKITERSQKLAVDKPYQKDYLEMHNSPAWKVAQRMLQLYNVENSQGSSLLPLQFLFPLPSPFANKRIITDPQKIIAACDTIWRKEVVEAIARLPYDMPRPENPTCQQVNEWTNNYYRKRAAIENSGMQKIKQIYMNNASRLDQWMKLNIYATMDEKEVDGQTSRLISSLDKTIGRRLLENFAYKNFVDYGLRLVSQQQYLQDYCHANRTGRRYPPPKDLPKLVKHDLPCEYIRELKTPIAWYSEQCSTLEKGGKIQERKSPVRKGQGHTGRRNNQNRNNGPLGNGGRGPSATFYTNQSENENRQAAPLNAERKDLSQLSIEYDKWGNLVGLNFQLNEEGTALADPVSQDADIDWRWSWNAIASPQKGFLNKILMK